ncbi:hypothetical protein Poli38472_008072 [Pythium oligandrum]|uniref:Uncharacterized protein n=1 Tax=Pythium oligandrum TaxID=41045 RepID=A0A8K1FIW3_PYTOL|nr:hypothetical protein Poli38472_008072 [Pythium oligandrum]|eukprot:TMW65430.1 hypothetical protein Poli38472_008072 [Pythium oligandrum]
MGGTMYVPRPYEHHEVLPALTHVELAVLSNRDHIKSSYSETWTQHLCQLPPSVYRQLVSVSADVDLQCDADWCVRTLTQLTNLRELHIRVASDTLAEGVLRAIPSTVQVLTVEAVHVGVPGFGLSRNVHASVASADTQAPLWRTALSRMQAVPHRSRSFLKWLTGAVSSVRVLTLLGVTWDRAYTPHFRQVTELSVHACYFLHVQIHAADLVELPQLVKLRLEKQVDLIDQESLDATKTLVQRLHTFEPHTIHWEKFYFTARLPLSADSPLRHLVWPVNARPEFDVLPQLPWLEELDLSRLSCHPSRVDWSPLLLGLPRLRLLVLSPWMDCESLRRGRSSFPLLGKLLHPVENCWWTMQAKCVYFGSE